MMEGESQEGGPWWRGNNRFRQVLHQFSTKVGTRERYRSDFVRNPNSCCFRESVSLQFHLVQVCMHFVLSLMYVCFD
jgi:hypothetical protein